MKKIAISFSLAVMLTVAGINAQTLKLGHINSQELLQSMPESDSAQLKLEEYATKLENDMERMQVEFNNKYEDYINNAETYSELIRQTKESELGDLQNRIQQFQSIAQEDLAQRRTELFQPIQKKAKKAIEEVAAENGFTYVFDSGIGTIVYAADNSEDILPLVKIKLGLE